MNPAVQQQANGITHDEMREIHLQQINEEVNTVPANNGAKDQINDPYFKEDYGDWEIPEYETGFYHIAKEARLFGQGGATPQRLSVATVIKLNPKMYDFMKKSGVFNGNITHILHDPTKESASKSKEGEEGDDEFNLHGAKKSELQEIYLASSGKEAPTSWTKEQLIEEIEKLK